MRYFLVYSLETGDVVAHSVVTYSAMPDIPEGHGVWCASSVDQWSRAIRITGSGVELAEEVVRQLPGSRSVAKEVLTKLYGLYRASRRKAYDPLPEQIDRITKALASLQAAGIDIGEAGIEQVEHCQAVKAKYPKRVL